MLKEWRNKFTTNLALVIAVVLATLYTSAVLVFVLTITSGSHDFSIFRYMKNAKMRVYATYDRSDQVVENISSYCAPFTDAEDQASCVISVTCPLYNYTTRTGNDIKTPTELVESGGVCRDYAILIDAVMKNLGWYTDFVFAPGHVYNSMSKGNMYCIINGCHLDCY